MSNYQRRKPTDCKPERNIITGLILNDEFCKTIIPILKKHPGLFITPFTGTVARWIIPYWEKYGNKPPLGNIQEIFNKEKNNIDDDQEEMAKEFLTSLSDEYEAKQIEFNPAYEIENAFKYLQDRQFKVFQENLKKLNGSSDEQLKLQREFVPISLASVEEPEDKIISLRELQKMEGLPEMKYLVDGIVPSIGLMFLAGKPKTGKSSFVLNMAIDVALGRDVFGKIPINGPVEVLYLALEDTLARIKYRASCICDTFPEKCFFATDWPKSGNGFLRDLEKHMISHPNTELIIVDTFQKIRDPKKKDAGKDYSIDYVSLEGIQQFAAKHEISALVIHHTRKTRSDDIFQEISGTTGLAAAADSLAVLDRVKGEKNDIRILYTRGRDFEDGSILFQATNEYRWTLKGDASQYSLQTRQRSMICLYLNLIRKPVTRKDLVAALKSHVGEGIDVIFKKLTDRGDIEKLERGVYAYSGFKKDEKLGKVAAKIQKRLNVTRKCQ